MRKNILNVKVSVVMITYNHEKFIKEAIEGVLIQQGNFEVELIIADDNSPDNTECVVKDIKANHPNGHWIKYTKHAVNKGMNKNFTWALEQAIGEYISICEGDDYWTDPLKLLKQVDFLEENKNYSGVATNSLIKFEGTDKERLFRTNLKSILETNDLLEARHFHTATFMYRREAFKPDFPVNVLSADRTLFMLVSCIGPIRLLDDVTAVYRKNDGGISTKVTSKQMKQDYKIVDYIKKYSNDFDSLKLKIFITKTVLEYSHKIYFIDFINAAC